MKTIWLNPFSESSISNCIAELEAYKKSLSDKCIKLIEIMCREGEEYAITRWAQHIWSGETAESVMGYREGNVGVISVGGNAIWIEFGTGVYTAGYSYPAPLPDGISIHGAYGKSANDPNGWTYFDKFTGDFYHTHGHIGDPIMWETARKLEEEAHKYAKEAFNGTV